ncbi:MAG: hypothetical protein KZQ70_00395 [gamma proteobacterium symbiont of Lucinoma myriamae]|nr:hypothetical protein [gamma proteobacterium symbiont of Lucinoma myriamae]MCU7817495.1 hypothetical protein [gamma proteobacterium symbiont of Lucinoma myriamae]MCU7831072.1 hypothetical protein [gamma proteobacterium symbiont of Lucinoma myriamae]
MKNLIILLGCMMMLSSAASAVKLPHYYSGHSSNVGIVNSIDSKNQLININGKKFSVADKVKVHTMIIKQASMSSVSSGMKIFFSIGKVKRNRYEVTEIWVLPKDYQLQMP